MYIGDVYFIFSIFNKLILLIASLVLFVHFMSLTPVYVFQALHYVFTVLIVFFLCWSPQQFLMLWDVFRDRGLHAKASSALTSATFYLCDFLYILYDKMQNLFIFSYRVWFLLIYKLIYKLFIQ